MINKLRRIVENNCISRDSEINTLDYWSNIVFARCVFILVPLSILVVIPGIIISVQNQLYPILGLNLFCLSVIIIVGYVPGIAVKIRKLSLIFLVFLAVFFLLKELGNLGPGLAYLLSITVISLLLFPGKQTSLPFIFTLLFCVFYGLLIHYGYVEIQSIKNNQLMEWIAVSSNVVFMSAIFSLLIPFFLSKLEETLSEKMLLLDSVSKMNIELERSIAEIKSKNSELEQFAFIASHDMQEPLRMITSFMDKLKLKLGDQLDDKANQYIYYATDAAKRMRQIILDLLEYLRAGKPTEPMVKVDLNDVLQEYKELRRDIKQLSPLLIYLLFILTKLQSQRFFIHF
jgi:signal transduction histidine kinase